MQKSSFINVDEYIAMVSSGQQKLLRQMRRIVRKAAPHAEEIISYKMPAYKQHRVLVYFAMAKNHLGFYPTSSGIKNFQGELKDYKTSKGAVQFPLNKSLPENLIQKIVTFRVQEDIEKNKNKSIKK